MGWGRKRGGGGGGWNGEGGITAFEDAATVRYNLLNDFPLICAGLSCTRSKFLLEFCNALKKKKG